MAAIKPSLLKPESMPPYPIKESGYDRKDLYSRTSLKKKYAAALEVGLPEADSGVTDAFYPFPNKAHGHHLQDATDEVECAADIIGEGTRVRYQENSNKDEVIK